MAGESESGAALGGLVIRDGKGLEIGASDHSVETLTDAWAFTLTWIGENELVTICIILLLGIWAFVWRRASLEKTRMKLDYKERRRLSASNEQGSLFDGRDRVDE